MKVSIIIPTYNRSIKLVNLLTALEEQTFKEFETIVVDDGSTDNTQSVLKNRGFSLRKLRIVHQKNQGHAVARNQGAKKASGNLLIFFDSDVRPFPDCVERHLNHHKVKNHSILTGRAVMDNSLFPDSDFCQYRYYLESKIWSFPSTNGLAKVTPDNYFFSTQNLSLSRCLFNELGKFDESLIDSVDFDLCAKAMIENVPIYYDNEVAVWHDDQGKIEDYINRQIQYHKSRRRLAKLKPEYVNIIPSQFYQGKNDVIRRFMKKVFIVNRTWFSIIDSRFYEEVIPKWIRYKIYGYLIHSTSMAKS